MFHVIHTKFENDLGLHLLQNWNGSLQKNAPKKIICYLQLFLLLLLDIIILCGSFESLMSFPLVISYTTLPRKLLVALPARVFDSFMYCPFMSSKMSLCSSLMITLPTRVFDSFMYCLFVLNKISFWCCSNVALPARIFHSFMYCPLQGFHWDVAW